jgi:hypothetical protein
MITLLASTLPTNELMLDTFGCDPPSGQAVMYASGPGGTAVSVTEYAAAAGTVQYGVAGNRNFRVSRASMDGGPNGPACGRYTLRVSITRQGVSG